MNRPPVAVARSARIENLRGYIGLCPRFLRLKRAKIISLLMKPIAAPIVGGMVTSTIHVLILVPVFFAIMKERALRKGTLSPSAVNSHDKP